MHSALVKLTMWCCYMSGDMTRPHLFVVVTSVRVSSVTISELCMGV